MIRIQPGDLLAVAADGRQYYALILDRIRLFGGHWTFVFHRTSEEPLAPTDLLQGPRAGFHAFVDFIWARREDRVRRLQTKVSPQGFEGPGYLKWTSTISGRPSLWIIYDMDFREVTRVAELSPTEQTYPEFSRIDDVLMVRLIDQSWLPEHDPRITAA